MRLVFTDTGEEVKVGSRCTIDGRRYEVTYFRPPHKSASEGKVSVRPAEAIVISSTQEYYVSVIGAKWIEREDRGEQAHG